MNTMNATMATTTRMATAPMMEMAQAEVHGAEATKRPDWGVELSYGHRGAAFSDMVSLQFTLGLPVFSGTRQDPQIEAKRQVVIAAVQ